MRESAVSVRLSIDLADDNIVEVESCRMGASYK